MPPKDEIDWETAIDWSRVKDQPVSEVMERLGEANIQRALENVKWKREHPEVRCACGRGTYRVGIQASCSQCRSDAEDYLRTHCSKHPDYTRAATPTVLCERCWYLWFDAHGTFEGD